MEEKRKSKYFGRYDTKTDALKEDKKIRTQKFYNDFKMILADKEKTKQLAQIIADLLKKNN